MEYRINPINGHKQHRKIGTKKWENSCKFKNCNIKPSFNYEGEKIKLYCYNHKKENMINIKNKKCVDCNIQASYNIEGTKLPLYCVKHKKNNMINIVSRRCKEKDCNKIPKFNFEGKKGGLYCDSHKLVGMINVKDKLCKEKDCNIRPSFNYKYKKPGIYCSKHKKDDMINVENKPYYCKEKDCKLHPNFNYEGEKSGLYCLKHKKEDMIDVKHSSCINDFCDTQVNNNKYDGYCFSCYVKDPKNKDKPIVRNYKMKERAVEDYIKEQYPELSLKFDKTIKGGQSLKRPDIILDLGYQVLIVEIDEDQHKYYKCKNKRMMQLSLDIKHRPMILIRFNPDDYMKGKEKIKSCFSYNKRGLCRVNKKDMDRWNERLSELKNQIDYWMKNKTEKTIEIIHLFYNE